MTQKIVSITFFSDSCARNFFVTGKSVCFHSIDYLFMPPKIVSITFFTDSSAQNFIFMKKSVCFYPIDYFFDSCSSCRTQFLPINKHFFYKNMFLRTYHTFVSKFHIVCTSQPAKYDDRPLFKTGDLCLICCHFETIQSKDFVRISKQATVVEGNQKASFSIATTPRRGRYSFP